LKIHDKFLNCRTYVLICLFSLADLLAIFLDALHCKGVLESRFFRLARDRGFAELIQYGKFGLIILMLIRWSRVRQSRLLAAWCLLFCVLLADDSLGLHEAIGGLFMQVLPFPSIEGIRVKDMAEGLAFLLLEGMACLYVMYHYFRAPRDLQAYSRMLVLVMIPLFCFGLVLDILPFHSLEQPGEMVAMSILLAFVHVSYHRRMRPVPGRGFE